MCGITGVFGNKNAAKLVALALFSMQHRGQETAGISSNENGKMHLIKGKGLVNDVITEHALEKLKGTMAIGHNRYSTSSKKLFSQPLYAEYKLGEISLVHNGNLINKNEIRDELISSGAIFKTALDTENILHLIARSNKDTLKDRIIEAINIIKGTYCLIIQGNDKQYIVRDKHGVRPLSIGKLKSGGYIVASETCSFILLDAEYIRDVRPGEMIILSKKGLESIQLFEPDFRPDSFEYIYLSRPDSDISGINVYESRVRCGQQLSRNDILLHNKVSADMVVPVPDSGNAAAIGYSVESGIPYVNGIIRNHYVGRTFIEPFQKIRNLKVKMKLSPLKSVIQGKDLIVVDDSLVRGTTSKEIVKMLKSAGVKKIHFRIASPEVKFPSFYGIDIPTHEELISAKMNKEQLRKFIGADSIEFISIADMINSIGNQYNYATEIFDGNYFI